MITCYLHGWHETVSHLDLDGLAMYQTMDSDVLLDDFFGRGHNWMLKRWSQLYIDDNKINTLYIINKIGALGQPTVWYSNNQK